MKRKLITKQVIFQRLKRQLYKDKGLVLCKSRPGKSKQDPGDYYTVNPMINGIVDKHIDIESLGRELGLLKDDEVLFDPDDDASQTDEDY